MQNIVVEKLHSIPVSEQRIEIVERKGIGHPDTICDSIMNQISINLSHTYLKKYGLILHHNIDKALLSAGETINRFGGGTITKPMKLIIGDRATFAFQGIEIPVDEIALDTAKKWFKENLRFVDPEKDVKYQIELKPSSPALSNIFMRTSRILPSNDTSAVVGYAPLTPTEKIVYEIENFLNSKDFKKEFPETGEDIKVMGCRSNSNLDLTIAMAFVDRLVESENYYFRKKEEILERLKEFIRDNYNEFENITIYLNTLDEKGKGVDGLFLTVTGTCADSADSGQVGRGNRVNGVISLSRPTGNEAAAGKNPVAHVGKIYNLLSFKIANEIYNRIPRIKEVYVWLLSQIGVPIDKPKISAVQVIPENYNELESAKEEIRNIVSGELEQIDKFCMKLVNGEVSVC